MPQPTFMLNLPKQFIRPLGVLIFLLSAIPSSGIFAQSEPAADASTTGPARFFEDRMVEIPLSGKKSIPLESQAERIGIETEGVVSAFMPDPKTLELTGEGPGYTVLLIQYADGGLDRWIIHVAAAASGVIRNLTEQLRNQLKSVTGLQVSTDGISIALTGEIDAEGKALIKPYSQMLKGIVRDETTVFDPSNVPPPVVIATPTPEPAATPPPPPDYSDRIVQIDVQIIQVEKDHRESLGIDWFASGGWRLSAQGTVEGGYQASTAGLDESISGVGGGIGNGGSLDLVSGNGGFGMATGSVRLSNMEWVLEALVRQGVAKVLATPKLTVQSGRPAEFLVGGELPIVQTNALSSTVEYKKFGTRLQIDPVVVSDTEVYITVNAEVSAVDEVQRVQGVPSIRTRQASTYVTVKDGLMFAIAGLLSTEITSEDRSVPVLSSIPLVGGLFRSERAIEKDLETIILMTPYILRSDGSTVPPAARIQPGQLVAPVLSAPAEPGQSSVPIHYVPQPPPPQPKPQLQPQPVAPQPPIIRPEPTPNPPSTPIVTSNPNQSDRRSSPPSGKGRRGTQ